PHHRRSNGPRIRHRLRLRNALAGFLRRLVKRPCNGPPAIPARHGPEDCHRHGPAPARLESNLTITRVLQRPLKVASPRVREQSTPAPPLFPYAPPGAAIKYHGRAQQISRAAFLWTIG